LTALPAQRRATLEEEMRLLYVAVTRAENAVLFVGSGPRGAPPNPPESDYYAWRDEIRRAWRSLSSLGAQVWE
jgi:ATP-dependent exoDNAse (exonuclease V) beta subunit